MGGWSFPPSVFAAIRKKSNHSWQVMDWPVVCYGPDRIVAELDKGPCVLLGWSLGGFLLYPYLDHHCVLGGVFLAIGPTFVRSPLNPYGVKKAALKAMINGLNKKPDVVVKQFQRRCQGPSRLEKMEDQLPLLRGGLEYLREVILPPLASTTRHYILHGRRDRVLDWRSSLVLAKRRGAICHLSSGGHGLLEEEGEYILELLQGFV